MSKRIKWQFSEKAANMTAGVRLTASDLFFFLENVEEDDEIEKATALAEKFVKNRQIDAKIKQKCLAHLIYNGYDYSVA